MRTAVAVAFADGRLTPAETVRVAHVADALGLDEADLRGILGGKGQAR